MTAMGQPEESLACDMETFFAFSPDLLCVADLDGNFLRVNAAFTETLGHGADDLLLTSYFSLIHPDDVAGTEAALNRLGTGTSVIDFDNRFRAADGTYRTLRWRARPIGDRVYATARDVTEEVEARSALARSEQRLQAIVEHSEASIWAKGRDGRYLFVNAVCAQRTGRTPVEMVGLSNRDVWPDMPEVADQVSARDAEVLASGRSTWFTEQVRLNGEVHLFQTVRFAIFDEDGRPTGVCGIATDVTEHDRVSTELGERNGLLHATIKASPDLTSVIDATGRLDSQLSNYHEVLGYPDLALDQIHTIVHPDDLGALAEAFQALVLGRSPTMLVRLRIRHADGRWLSFDARGRPVFGEDRSRIGSVIVCRDITDQSRLEELLRKAKDGAEEASQAKSQFMSRMSHELRTPLNSILGFGQLLEAQDLEADDQEAVAHILRGGRHLLGLIDEVLDVAKIESGRPMIELESVSLRDLVANAIGLVPLTCGVPRVTMRIDQSAADLHVRADARRLLQVVLNLLTNAVKYNRPGGQVVVGWEATCRGRVCVSIVDTGYGVADADLRRIFEPFVRVLPPGSTIEGKGVGLALTAQLLSLMGGTIGVESTVGRGSTFWFELEAASAPLAAGRCEGAAGPLPTPSLEVHRVLQVEDTEANRVLVERALRRLGPSVEVVSVGTGREAIDLARTFRPDVILLDLHLPDMDGADVLTELRADWRTAAVPVIVVSADATLDTIAALDDLGAVAYLTKPIELDRLEETLRLIRA
ncbi:MAG: PAS domain S-box protein [Acidimicrobiales bacterium]